MSLLGRICFAIALLGATPAAAICSEAWFARNLIFDRVGYCFGSVLGSTLFDNRDCTPGDVTMSSGDLGRVARTRQIEAEFGCLVDSSRQALPEPAPEYLRIFDPVPIANGGESACIGWQGDPVLLRSGPGGRVTGELRPGDMILLLHDAEPDATFLTVMKDNVIVGRGWHLGPIDLSLCDGFAG